MEGGAALEEEFTARCYEASSILKQKYRYNAARFNRMLATRGGPGTAKELIAMVGQSDGYAFLYSVSRLDLSAEALCLLPKYSPLFTDAEVKLARATLTESGLDIKRFLERATSDPPPWHDF